MDAIDRKILKFLIKNARMPFLEIARECGISGAAIHQRIRKLDESGVILGSRLVVDPKMLGFDVCAHIGISLNDPQLLTQTMERLKKVPEIVECHFVTGAYNILVKLYCLDEDHLRKHSQHSGHHHDADLHLVAGGVPAAGERRFSGGVAAR